MVLSASFILWRLLLFFLFISSLFCPNRKPLYIVHKSVLFLSFGSTSVYHHHKLIVIFGFKLLFIYRLAFVCGAYLVCGLCIIYCGDDRSYCVRFVYCVLLYISHRLVFVFTCTKLNLYSKSKGRIHDHDNM